MTARPAACHTERPGRVALIITPDRILYSDGTSTLWRPDGPVSFPTPRRLTRNRHGARWIVYATGWGRVTLRRADCLPPDGAVPVTSYRAPAGTIAGTPGPDTMRRYHAALAFGGM